MSAAVVVVGAGIAGLYAAHLLQRAGVPVTVLEASSRAGGRMDTVYDDSSGRALWGRGAGRRKGGLV